MSTDFEENALGTGILGDTIFGPELPSFEPGASGDLRIVYARAEVREVASLAASAIVAALVEQRTAFAPAGGEIVYALPETRVVYATPSGAQVSGSSENRTIVLPIDV